jgi:hypothetical protein
MTLTFARSGKVSVALEAPSSSSHLAEASKEGSAQSLCDEIFNLGDMLACYIFGQDGSILGTHAGEIEVDEQLKTSFGGIAAVVWGGLKRVEDVGGPINFVSAVYRNFKIVGIPFPGLKLGVLATVPVSVDALYLKERVTDFMAYWNQVEKPLHHALVSR